MTNSDADYESMQDCDLQHVVDPPILDTNQPTFSGSYSSEMHSINELVHVPVLAPPTTIQTRLKNNIFKPKNFFSLTATKHLIPPSLEPTTTTEALKHKEWRDAMCEELDALKKNGTWELVPPAAHQNVIGCKWVFRIKRNPDGSIARYKARLVAKGFH